MTKLKIKLICLMATLLVFCAHTKEGDQPIVPTSALPLEFQFLFSSLIKDIEENNFSYPLKDFTDDIKKLENHLNTFPDFFVQYNIKGLIYKSLLEIEDSYPEKDLSYSSELIKKLNQKFLQSPSQYHLFSRWIIESVQTDLWDLTETSDAKKNPARQYRLLGSMLKNILFKEPLSFNQLTNQIGLNLIKNLNLYFEFIRLQTYAANLLPESAPKQYFGPQESLLSFKRQLPEDSSTSFDELILKITNSLNTSTLSQEGNTKPGNTTQAELDKKEEIWLPQNESL